MQKYLLIALGGALGSMARVWVGSTVSSRLGVRFPYGTLLVNVSACLIIGFSMALINRRAGLNEAWRYLVPMGFIGAYSTFSTFEWEIFTNIQAGTFLSGGIYMVVSLALGLTGVWCGAMASQLVP